MIRNPPFPDTASNVAIMDLPAYSPDFNPLDFFLWNDIDRRMTASPKGKENVEQFKQC